MQETLIVAARPLRILVSGMIASVPRQGGATWAVLQYVLGFQRLGHDVLFVEPVKSTDMRPAGARLAESGNAEYFRHTTRRFGLESRAALLEAATQDTVGVPYADVRSFASRADVLINLSGVLRDESLLAGIPTRVFVDIDPAFNQLWHAIEGIDLGFGLHTRFVTIGMNIGHESCSIPTCGIDWIHSPQPVVLEHWPVEASPSADASYGLTTIANWRAYGSIEYAGVFYGQKAHSLRRFLTVPALTGERFVLALSIHPDEVRDLAALSSHGWELVDPFHVAGDPDSYRAFARASRAEFGIAKSGYVESRCGWFSDRSLCYLATGRPVLAQDTGFGRWLPAGEGVLAFATPEDVARHVESLSKDYARHARAARAMAERWFDSDRVLAALLDRIDVTAGSPAPRGVPPAERAPTAELRTALEIELQRRWGAGTTVATIDRKPSAYQSSSGLEQVEVGLADGRRLTLMFKDLGREAMLEEAARVKPAHVFDPRREIEVYRRLLAPNGLAAAWHGARVDEEAGRYWLFVEKVRGRELYQVGEFDAWLDAARWLARMHAKVGRPDPGVEAQAHLLQHDEDACLQWLERAARFARTSGAAADVLSHLETRYSRVIDRLQSLPVVFLHGEFYASNILVEDSGAIRPIDWEMAAIGPSLLDLAALVSGTWSESKRRALAEAYGEALQGEPLAPAHAGRLVDDLMWCRLHVAVQWLGWASHWTPPGEHAHDWLQDVRDLTDRLGL